MCLTPGAADRGTLSGSSITGTTRREGWTLDQLGNWSQYTTDSNATSPWDTTDNRTHNAVNELTARSTPSATLAYDDAGQMTDDGASYKYVYDAFGRLVEVKNQSNATVATHRSNALG